MMRYDDALLIAGTIFEWLCFRRRKQLFICWLACGMPQCVRIGHAAGPVLRNEGPQVSLYACNGFRVVDLQPTRYLGCLPVKLYTLMVSKHSQSLCMSSMSSIGLPIASSAISPSFSFSFSVLPLYSYCSKSYYLKLPVGMQHFMVVPEQSRCVDGQTVSM